MYQTADLEYLSRITAYSCQYDPRFSYFVYVPQNWLEADRPSSYHLLVVIHGTERSPEMYRQKLKPFAEKTNTIIMAPLFPAGLIDPKQIENYNLLRFHDIEFDTVLLHMIDELAERFPINKDEGFNLHGFSAGGQYVHRFFYLYPGYLKNLSIGAPGNITFLDFNLLWPKGIGGTEQVFGKSVDLEQLKKVPVQIVVGEEDTYIHNPDESMNRLELNHALFVNMKSLGLNVRFDLQPGAGHNGFQVLSLVTSFFEGSLS